MSEPIDEYDEDLDDSEEKPARMVFKSAADMEKAKKEQVKDNKVLRLLEKNPLGMTLPEMAGGPRQLKKIKTLRPMLAEAVRLGLVMPVNQRANSVVYRLVKNMQR